MIGLDALTTFSGVLVAAATYLAVMGKRFVAGIIYIIAGSGGLAILWERWSPVAQRHPAHSRPRIRLSRRGQSVYPFPIR